MTSMELLLDVSIEREILIREDLWMHYQRQADTVKQPLTTLIAQVMLGYINRMKRLGTFELVQLERANTTPDQTDKRLRTIRSSEVVWSAFDEAAQNLDLPVAYLVNQAMERGSRAVAKKPAAAPAEFVKPTQDATVYKHGPILNVRSNAPPSASPSVDQEFPSLEKLLSAHPSAVRRLLFLPNSELILSCSKNSGIELWDFQQNTRSRRYTEHTNSVSSMVVSACGSWVYSCDGALNVWDTKSGKLLARLTYPEQLRGLGAVSPDGQWMTVWSDSGFHVINLHYAPTQTRLIQPTTSEVEFLYNNTAFTTAHELTYMNAKVVTGVAPIRYNLDIHLVDLSAMKETRNVGMGRLPPRGELDFGILSADGQWFTTAWHGRESTRVFVYLITPMQQWRIYLSHSDQERILCLALNESFGVYGYVPLSKAVIFRIGSKGELHTIQWSERHGYACSAAFSTDGRTLAIGTTSGSVLVFPVPETQ